MAQLPQQYAWLNQEVGPRIITEALRLFDTKESLGTVNNPTILSWAQEIGGNVADLYLADSIPWCGLFMAVVAKRAGKQLPVDPLWALNWGTFGKKTSEPMLGDVLTFTRITNEGKKAGHVAIYIGEDDDAYHVLGGNQSDKVSIVRKAKNRLYAARRPNYNNQPANVRKIKLSNLGGLGGNEA